MGTDRKSKKRGGIPKDGKMKSLVGNATKYSPDKINRYGITCYRIRGCAGIKLELAPP
jgi:hypothetical protein